MRAKLTYPQKMRLWSLIAIADALCLLCTACGESDLRGTFKPSKDGKTYLAVVDDNGGHCGPMKVDGKLWPHPIGEMGEVSPGHHKIECGGEIEFDVRQSVVYKFNYWGPWRILRTRCPSLSLFTSARRLTQWPGGNLSRQNELFCREIGRPGIK